jgi:type IV pilus assembly protein PilC
MANVTSQPSAALVQQLASATHQGLPLADAAAILAADLDTVPQGASTAFAAALAAGDNLATAFAQSLSATEPATVQWILLAEQQRQLPAALQAWGDDLAQLANVQRARRLAMLWPSTLAVAVLALWIVLALFVMPVFAETFASFGSVLPLPSRVVFAVTQAAAGLWWLLAGIVALGVWAVWRHKMPKAISRMALSVAGRLGFVARWRAAVFGHRLVRLLTAHPNDGPMQAASIGHLAATTPYAVWAAAAARMQEGLLAGQGLGAVLQAEAALPRRMAAFVLLGEKTGQTPAALVTLAETAADELHEAQARLERGTVLLLYLLLGLTVGALVLAVYLPIFSMGALV